MGKTGTQFTRATPRAVGLFAALTMLGACADMQMPAFLTPKDGANGETVSRASTPLGLGALKGAKSERDVEAPDVFQASEAGLWDGRPSLGGVWVAHPDVKDPERVIIRNEKNGKFVIGALFRREREAPGPRLQVSSDAAAALGVLAGSPTNLNVVALRREEITTPEPDPNAVSSVPDAPLVSEGTLDDPAPAATASVADVASAALDAAPAVATTPAPKPTQAAAAAVKPSSSLAKPYIQIGIFSVEQNAKNTAEAMRQAGMVPTVKKQSSKGKTFWRVVVGPAQTKAELSTLLKTIKGTGFGDAYAVTH